MNEDSLINWISGVCKFLGHGGKKHVAATIGIIPSNLTKLITRRRGFDEKTIRTMAWILTSKAENYLHLPVIEATEHDGIIWEKRQDEENVVITWRTE